MSTCFYYWFVQPMREDFQDTAETAPVWEVQVEFGSEKLSLAVFVDDAGPQYARLTISNLPSTELPDRLLPILQAVKEHLVSTLRLTFHPEASLFPSPMWTFSEQPERHSIGMTFKAHFGVPEFDAQRARNVFVSTFALREDLRLFIDGANSAIPLQYRFLSAYKLLELEFKKRGQWQSKELDEFLEQFDNRFREIGVTRKPASYLADLRDRCAHIKSGRQKERLGVTHLNHKQAVAVEQVLPILGEIGMVVLQRRGKGKFELERRHWLQYR